MQKHIIYAWKEILNFQSWKLIDNNTKTTHMNMYSRPKWHSGHQEISSVPWNSDQSASDSYNHLVF